MSISVIVRPPLFCAACGGAMWTEQVSPETREVRCLQKGCPQFDDPVEITDHTITHLAPGEMASLRMTLDLNPQPREH